jgi:hypothetical protein
MEFRKEHFLYLALAIPVFMIAVVALGVAFSSADLRPHYNFIYTLSPGMHASCQTELEQQFHPQAFPLKDRTLAKHPGDFDCAKLDLYLYDFKTKAIRKLTQAQARSYHLFSGTNRLQSPDGFTVQAYCYTGSSPGWWWGASADSGWSSVCLKKDERQQRLNIKRTDTTDYPYPQFIFLGWIKDSPQ